MASPAIYNNPLISAGDLKPGMVIRYAYTLLTVSRVVVRGLKVSLYVDSRSTPITLGKNQEIELADRNPASPAYNPRKFHSGLTDLQMINARRFLVLKRKGWSVDRIARDQITMSPDTIELYIRNAEAEERSKERNPLFDRYTVRTSDNSISKDNILTLSGAERQAKQFSSKYPCAGIEIVSQKFGTVIKSYSARTKGGPVKVDKDNTRDYKKQEEENQTWRLEVDVTGHGRWEEQRTFTGSHAKKDAEAEGRSVQKKDGVKWRVKEVKENPSVHQHNGILYFSDYAAARQFATAQGLKVDRIVKREQGWVIEVKNPTPVNRKRIRVTYADGNAVETEINGTEEEIRRYYVGQYFDVGGRGDRDNLQKAVKVEFLKHNPAMRTGRGDLQVSNPRQGAGISYRVVKYSVSGHPTLIETYSNASDAKEHAQIAFERAFPGESFAVELQPVSGSGVQELFRTRSKALGKRNPREAIGAKSKTATGSASGKGASVGKTRTQAGSASGKGASVGKTRTSTQASTKGNRTVTLTSSPGARISFGKNPAVGGGRYNIVIADSLAGPSYDNENEARAFYRDAVQKYPGTSIKLGDRQSGKFLLHHEGTRGKKRNPSGDDAAELFETFHGTPATHEVLYEETHEIPDAYAELGDLVELWVVLLNSRSNKAIKIAAPSPDRPLDEVVKLASNAEGNQLYFIGGDQALDLAALGFEESEERPRMTIGVLVELTYQSKKHFHKFKLIDYYHKLGEENGKAPFLTYNAQTRRMGVSGGDYVVRAEGIVN